MGLNGIARVVLPAVVMIASAIGTAATQHKIYWIDSNVIHRADFDGRHVEHVLDVPGVAFNEPLSVDPLGGRIYWSWSEIDHGQIRSSNLFGEGVEFVLPLGLFVGPGGVVVDSRNRMLYLTDESDCIPLCGSVLQIELNSDDLHVVIALDAPIALAVDAAVDRICWYDLWNEEIACSDLAGGQVQIIASDLEANGIAIDRIGGRVYWTDAVDHSVRRANLDGTDVQDVVTGLVDPYGIAVDSETGTLYWSDRGAGKIERAKLNGTGVEDVLVGLNAPSGIALDLGQWAIEVVVGRTALEWSAVDGATSYDVVLGDLSILRHTDGGFRAATEECLANDSGAGVIDFVDDPDAGEGFWFLVRAVTSTGDGTYDGAGFPQSGSRDAGIVAAGTPCE